MLPLLYLVTLATAFVKLDFGVYHGDEVSDIHKASSHIPGYVKRSEVEMILHNQQTWYLSDLYIGSNKDKISVLVDTGSSDLWIHSHDVFCQRTSYYKRDATKRQSQDEHLEQDIANRELHQNQPREVANKAESYTYSDSYESTSLDLDEFTKTAASSNTCSSYGTFNTGESESFQANETNGEFFISYADDSYALGIYGIDSISLDPDNSDSTLNDFCFAVANITNSEMGVFGIGLMSLENSYDIYENFPEKMKSEGLIKKNAYSLYLNQPNAKSGSVLFGGVDHAKYEGQLTTVPLISTYDSGTHYRTTVALSGMKFNTPEGNFTLFENQNNIVLLDSGATWSHFRSRTLGPIASMLGGEYDSYMGGYMVPCTSDPDVYFDLDFNGVTIKVPLVDLLYPYQGECMLTILSKSSLEAYDSIGDNILRNGYFVYDLDDKEVSIAQVKYSEDSDIDEIESSVPSAVKAEGYSSTDYSYISVASTRSMVYPTNEVSAVSVSGFSDLLESESDILESSTTSRGGTSRRSTDSNNSDDASTTQDDEETSATGETTSGGQGGGGGTTTSDEIPGSGSETTSGTSSTPNTDSSNIGTNTPGFISFTMLIISLVTYGIFV